MKKIFAVISCLAALFCCKPGVAQSKGDVDGTLHTTIISEFQPEISRNIKKISESPAIRDSAVPAPNINYSLQPRKFETVYNVEPIKPAKMKGEKLDRLYRGYIKGGVGNYTSLYGEGWYNSTRSKDGSWDAHIRHFSSSSSAGATPGFSGFSEDELNLAGKKFIGKHTLDGGLDYSRNVNYFYGDNVGNYSHAKDSIRQFFNYVSGNVGLLSHFVDSSKINHDVRLNYYFLSDHYKTSETNIRLKGSMSTYLHTELIGLDVAADYFNNHSRFDTTNETILKLHPFISANGDKWQVRAGLASITEFGKGPAFFSFLPDAEASYDIYKHIITPYVGISGDVVRNSYKRLTDENPFVSPSVSAGIQNTRYKYMLFGGLRGSLSSNTSYDAHVTYGKVENAAFFVNDTLAPQRNRFTVVYDDGTLLRFHGEVAWHKTEKWSLFVKGDYVRYFLDHEIQQWHTPTTRFTITGKYNLKNKIYVHADVFLLNQQYARYYERNMISPYHQMQAKSREIGSLADINLGFEYRYTKFLSGFVNFNNIGAVRYERWNNYPTQGFNLLAGLTYIF